MKYVVLLPLLLSGCITFEQCKPTIVEVPVWTPPQFEKPIRPMLRDINESKSDGEVIRNTELNILDIMRYTEDLELIINKIK